MLMQRISLSRDNVRVLKRAAHAELSMRLLGTARRHILDIADGPQHERAGEWIAAVAEVKHTSGLPPKLASMDECSLRSRKGALCPTHKYLPIPRCYFHSDASELAAAAEQEEEDEEGEEEEDEVGDVEEVDDGDRDPTEMLWEYSINAWLGENYSMASAYPDQLYLSVVPTTNHESPWSIVLGMRTYMPPGTTQTTLDDPPEEFNSPKQVHEVYKRTRRGLDRSTEWRLLFSRHNIKALHYQRLREEIPEWLEVTDNIEPMLQKATVYECGNEHFDGAVAGLLVLEVHGPPDIEHKQATHGTGMFEPTVDFTDGAVRRARRYFVVAPAPALEMFVAALHKDDVVGWHGVRDVLQKGIEGDLPGVSEATSDHGHTSTQRSSWAHEYWPPVYNDTAAARIAKLDEGNFDAFVQTHELSVIFFYSSSSREFDHNGAPSDATDWRHPVHDSDGRVFFATSMQLPQIPFAAIDCVDVDPDGVLTKAERKRRQQAHPCSFFKYLNEVAMFSSTSGGMCSQTSQGVCRRYHPKKPLPDGRFSCCGVKGVDHISENRAQIETAVYLDSMQSDEPRTAFAAASIARPLDEPRGCPSPSRDGSLSEGSMAWVRSHTPARPTLVNGTLRLPSGTANTLPTLTVVSSTN